MKTIIDSDISNIIKNENLTKLDVEEYPKEGDKILITIGRYEGRHIKEDFRWIKGYVNKTIHAQREITDIATGKREINYQMMIISPYKKITILNFLPYLFRKKTIDESQKLCRNSYGRILKYNNN